MDQDLGFQKAMEELEQMLVEALREYLTLGGKSENIRLLCQQTGISYDQVVGG